MKRVINPIEMALGKEDDMSHHGVSSLSVTRQGRKQHVTSIKLQNRNSSSCRVNGMDLPRLTDDSSASGESCIGLGASAAIGLVISAQLLFQAFFEFLSVAVEIPFDGGRTRRRRVFGMGWLVTLIGNSAESKLDVVA